jgi:predicted metallo-beta-lactamase superfamily hydrolase
MVGKILGEPFEKRAKCIGIKEVNVANQVWHFAHSKTKNQSKVNMKADGKRTGKILKVRLHQGKNKLPHAQCTSHANYFGSRVTYKLFYHKNFNS